MKQPKPAKSPLPPSPTPVSPGPRYRYFSNPPSTVTLRLGDLGAQIPADLRLAAFDELRIVELPCEEILRGPVPAIALSRLSALVPDCVGASSGGDPVLRLPAARLAAGYRFIHSQELIEEPPPPVAIVDDLPPPEEFGKADLPAVPESAKAAEPARDPAPPAIEPAPLPPKESASGPSAVVFSPEPEKAPLAAEAAPAPAAPAAQIEPPPVEAAEPPLSASLPPVPPPEHSSPGTAGADVPPIAPPAAKLPQSRRIFSILPIFRRKEAPVEPPPAPPAAKLPEPRPRVEIPKPKMPQSPIKGGAFPMAKPGPLPPAPTSDAARELERNEPAPPAVEAVVDEAAPSVKPPEPPPGDMLPPSVPEPKPLPVAEPAAAKPAPKQAPEPAAVWVETEHLPHSDRRVPEEIPDQEGLQAVFMTEEFLSLDRVIALCGGLPGIKSCVLAHGSAVLAAHSVPDTIDIISLSANALEMLRGMRESSAKMGVGAIPAVTLHSDKGPITFFHQDDLCLLVLHKDRGFVPGVREKLQQVVEELGKANLPLLVSPAKSSLNG